MPELPEVETIVNDLNKKIINKKISKVEINLQKIVKNNLKDFIQTLKNNSFEQVLRRGKLIIFKLNKDDQFLLIHLRMTGQLIYQEGNKIIAGGHSEKNRDFSFPNKHTHVVIIFQDKSKLFFNDQRQFGVLKIVDHKNLDKELKKIGAEPLSSKFSFSYFSDLLLNRKGNIKAFLLNQKYIAGIGNIYADEILFASHIYPFRKIESLKLKEKEDLFKNIKKILKQAIKFRGTTFNNYVDANGNKGRFIEKLKIYKKEGTKCKRCKNIIKKTKIAGRSTRYCSKCQK